MHINSVINLMEQHGSSSRGSCQSDITPTYVNNANKIAEKEIISKNIGHNDLALILTSSMCKQKCSRVSSVKS